MLKWLTIVCAVMLSACGQRDEPAPAVPAEDTPEVRIASLSPGITVTLRDLDLEELIVGRHGWDTTADQSLPVVGDQNGIDYETLLSVSPTHVLLQWGSRELPGRLVDLADDRGWVVDTFDSLAWDDVNRMELRLRELFDKPTAAGDSLLTAAVELSDEARARREAIGPLLLIMPGAEPAALGPGSFHYQIAADQLGARMAGPLSGPFVTLHAEDVVRLAPSAIVIFKPRAEGDASDEASWRALLGRLAELGLPAVESGRVAVINDPQALLAGTSLVRVRARMAEILDRWAARSHPGPP